MERRLALEAALLLMPVQRQLTIPEAPQEGSRAHWSGNGGSAALDWRCWSWRSAKNRSLARPRCGVDWELSVGVWSVMDVQRMDVGASPRSTRDSMAWDADATD